MQQSEIAIQTTNLTKSFAHFKAVDNLNLSVKKGEIFGFLGPNGAGKTTTLRMLAGLSKPDYGEINLLGKNVVFGSMSGRESIGYLPDVPECYGYMKPCEFLCFCGALYGLDPAKQKKKSDELLELVGLENTKKRIGGFSRGMKQRIGIAQALINDPDIVFMDEPASALDPMGRYDVMEIMTKLKGNTTVFFSTHIISDIERVCDTIAIIDKGSILEQGTIYDLKTKYDNNTISVTFADYSQNEDIGKFIGLLKNTSWCIDAVKSSANSNTIMIRVNNRKMAQVEIPAIISNLKLSLEFMNSHSLTLEDVFIKVVGK